jgi:hypothetical protein
MKDRPRVVQEGRRLMAAGAEDLERDAFLDEVGDETLPVQAPKFPLHLENGERVLDEEFPGKSLPALDRDDVTINSAAHSEDVFWVWRREDFGVWNNIWREVADGLWPLVLPDNSIIEFDGGFVRVRDIETQLLAPDLVFSFVLFTREIGHPIAFSKEIFGIAPTGNIPLGYLKMEIAKKFHDSLIAEERLLQDVVQRSPTVIFWIAKATVFSVKL